MTLLTKDDRITPLRIAESALTDGSRLADLARFHRWFDQYGRTAYTHVARIPLEDLVGWETDPTTGNIGHRSGKFFTVEGIDVTAPDAAVPQWSQPIINQPEVGILGILAKEFDGVLHLLMQAKVEPGNANGLQLSPTVQATRSNYTRVHQGKAVPYLEYFRELDRHRVIVDVRQSEQGSWFRQKRNRNLVVEVTEDVEPIDGYRWLTLGQVHRLLAEDDVVNMDARTVLSCLPFTGADVPAAYGPAGPAFHAALARSFGAEEGSLHPMEDVLSWITDCRTRAELTTRPIPLREVRGWRRENGRISHETGRFFDVIGVDVAAGGREVAGWTQPMIEPHGTGVVAFLAADLGGVLHVLVHARLEPGYLDVVELAATVQSTPDSYEVLPAVARPRFLDDVLHARPGRIRYSTILSEEGGRFYHARNRYLIVEAEPDPGLESADHRWLTLHQLASLLKHSHYVNVQARSLVACLHSLSST
jgi:oxidase EvaA